MAIVTPMEPASNGRRRLGLKAPSDQRWLGDIEVTPPEEVRAAVERARVAQRTWGARSIKERAKIIGGAVEVLLKHQEEIIETIREETGKTRVDALAVEIISSCDFLNYWSSRAVEDLADYRATLHGYLAPLKKVHVLHKPLGVIGVITPWNGPFVLAINPVLQSLLAGNAVVLKPSEISPRSSEWAVTILREAGVPDDAVQCVHGDGETGAALVNAGVDKISFTGSVPTGKKIAESCAKQLIPCTLELGGKDPMIVCGDANVERAANGAVFLGMFNTGQVCLGVERVYVVASVYDEFMRLAREKVQALRVGPGDHTDVGAVFSDRQIAIIERHVREAREAGATIIVGGERVHGDGLYFAPTLIADVTHDMSIMREETFGPVVCVMKVQDEQEAVRLANDSDYGLSASVFTTSEERCLRLAAQLDAGSVLMNDAAAIYGIPEAPFGGRKASGVGQIHGPHGLRGFTHPTPVVLDRFKLDTEDVWFPVSERTITTLEKTIRFAFGNRVSRRLMNLRNRLM